VACPNERSIEAAEREGEVSDEVHGLVESVPPQTYCGLPIASRSDATYDPLRVTCRRCRQLMHITGDMPNLSGEIEKNPGGRPRKRRWF